MKRPRLSRALWVVLVAAAGCTGVTPLPGPEASREQVEVTIESGKPVPTEKYLLAEIAHFDNQTGGVVTDGFDEAMARRVADRLMIDGYFRSVETRPVLENEGELGPTLQIRGSVLLYEPVPKTDRMQLVLLLRISRRGEESDLVMGLLRVTLPKGSKLDTENLQAFDAVGYGIEALLIPPTRRPGGSPA